MAVTDIHNFDPFNPINDLSTEVDYGEYTVVKYTNLGSSWYGIQLLNPPAYKQLTSPVSPDATRRIKVVKDDDPAYIYNEVSFTTAPSTNQFRADYYNRDIGTGEILPNYWSTGLIQFNSTELGQVVRVSYWRRGRG